MPWQFSQHKPGGRRSNHSIKDILSSVDQRALGTMCYFHPASCMSNKPLSGSNGDSAIQTSGRACSMGHSHTQTREQSIVLLKTVQIFFLTGTVRTQSRTANFLHWVNVEDGCSPRQKETIVRPQMIPFHHDGVCFYRHNNTTLNQNMSGQTSPLVHMSHSERKWLSQSYFDKNGDQSELERARCIPPLLYSEFDWNLPH